MGLPWPPTWEEGGICALCHNVIFAARTPIFVYAFTQGLAKCEFTPPLAPSPNGVIRMSQHPASNCVWEGHLRSGIYDYSYLYYFTFPNSHMVIMDISGMRVFDDTITGVCHDHFVNEWVCGAPDFPGFAGGTVDCFW